jgi:alkaline phosphatase D
MHKHLLTRIVRHTAWGGAILLFICAATACTLLPADETAQPESQSASVATRSQTDEAPEADAPAESALPAPDSSQMLTVTDTVEPAPTESDIDSDPLTIDTDAPVVSHGPISGEVSATSAVLWARGNMAGTLVFEVAPDDTFGEILRSASVEVKTDTDYTGEARMDELQPDQTYAYRVTLITDSGTSTPVVGQFATAPAADAPAAFSFGFSACLGGQNYCRDPESGWIIFDAIAAEQPDFFIFTGDTVYVDTACSPEENVPGAEGPYRNLEGFRTRYRYHLEDPPYARFLASTPVYVTWDDHEVINDFGGPALEAINPQLFAEGKQAFFEYWPLTGTQEDPQRIYRRVSYGAHADFFILDTRSYRDPNINWDPNPNTLAPKTMLGEEQFSWLQEGLSNSSATWKFIVTSVPLSYPTGFPQPQVDGRDGWANYTEPSGYENELQALLFFIAQRNIGNVVFLAGDTHWPYALSYDPDRDGTPNFYELASSPLSAIPLAPPEQLDPTFNPTVLYAEGEFMGDLFNFGHVRVAESGELTFRVLDRGGSERYALVLQPQ